SVCEIEETKGGKTQIVVTEIPYMVNKARLIEKMAELVKEKKIEGVAAIRDESNREGIRIVIELKRDANPQITLNRFYKHSQLQDSVSMIMLALVDGQPKLLTLRDFLVEYLKFQKEVVTRRTRFDLKKAEARAHILEGLRIALDNIDAIIKTIRESYNDAKEKLMKKFGLSDVQAQAILDMQLRRLQGLEREKIEAEYEELIKKIAYYNSLLENERLLMGVIKQELLEIKEKYGDPRRTKIIRDEGEFEEEDLVEEESVAITLTHLGYIKRVPADTYRAQRRGGRGITGITTRENDFVKDLVMTSTHDYLMFFTNTGKAHKIKAYEVPEAARTAKGTPAINFLNLLQRERITAMIPVKEFSSEKFLVAVTKSGMIKKTSLDNFDTKRSTGLIAISLHDDDSLIGIKESTGNNIIIIVTKKGKCISFSERDVRPMGRTAAGVRAIKLEKDDEVVSMELVEAGQQLLVVTENGFGKRTPVEDYKVQVRGGKGVLTYDKAKFKRTGNLIGAMVVDKKDEVLLINSDGIIIRIRAEEVSVLGRTTQGVKIMRVEEGTRIVAMAKAIRDEEDEPEEQPEPKKAAKGGKSGKGGKGAKKDSGEEDEQLTF
ncbi:MAG: DNA gyrase subunit A, partial [Eubacterium sp.]|nr:DNA gyrase subunit A [Eubacterium sp.]